MDINRKDDFLDPLFGFQPKPKIFQYFDLEDLVNMGLFKDVSHVFQALRGKYNVPPHVRFKRYDVRFPCEEFHKWLSAQTWEHKYYQQKQ